MPETPNVVLLTVDSLRYDAVFTESGAVKDDLDGFRRLVDRGTAFHDAWTCNGNTVSSFKSIFSGDYFWSHEGAYTTRSYEDSRLHIAEHFGDAGYATGGFHSNPFLHAQFDYGRGFDRYFSGGFENDSGGVIKRIENFVTNYKVTTELAMKVKNVIGKYLGRDIRGKGKPYTPAPNLHQRANDWLAGQSDPVFLWVHYMDVHNPWYPHEGTVSEGLDEAALLRTFYRVAENPEEASDADCEMLRTAYKGSVQSFDRHLDSFLDDIEAQLDDAVICLVSDHGELFGEDDWFFHGYKTYEDLLHVPLIIDAVDEPLEEQAPVGTIDIFPTLASLAGGGPRSEVDGWNLFTPLPADRKVFARGYDNLRVISAGESFLHDVSDLDSLSGLSEREQRQVSLVDPEGGDLAKVSADNDLDDQLEALGYK